MRPLSMLILTLAAALFAGEEAVKPPQAPADDPPAATPVKSRAKPVTTIDQLKQYVADVEAVFADSSYTLKTETHTERWWIGPADDARFALPNGETHVVPQKNRIFALELKLPTKGATITKEISREFETIIKETFDGWFPADELRAATASVRSAFNDSINQPKSQLTTKSEWHAGEKYKFKASLGRGGNFRCELRAEWIDPDSAEAVQARKQAGVK